MELFLLRPESRVRRGRESVTRGRLLYAGITETHGHPEQAHLPSAFSNFEGNLDRTGAPRFRGWEVSRKRIQPVQAYSPCCKSFQLRKKPLFFSLPRGIGCGRLRLNLSVHGSRR